MQVSNAELSSFDMYRQVNFATSREVLDVAVTAMLRAAWNCPCTLISNLLFDTSITAANMHALNKRWQSDYTVHVRA
jgi:hypothetical protein